MTADIQVGLPPEIADIIRHQIASFRRREVDLADDGFWRLRVAASPDDDIAHEFDGLTASTIERQRAADLESLDQGLEAQSIDVEMAHAWIRALNQLRLVMGTDLGVIDDDSWRRLPGQEGFAEGIIYDLLTQLQGELIAAVSRAEGFSLPQMAGPIPPSLLPSHATIRGGRLAIGGCDTLDLVEEFGSPLFVYDEQHLRNQCAAAVAAFPDGVVYATKAFLCGAMAQLAHEEGMGLDVSTGGELEIALRAGVPGHRLVMHGNNKSSYELHRALEAGVGRIVVDSFDELERLEEIADDPVPILIRITPGIEAHTHEYVATGHDDTKFGFTVSTGAADEAIRRAVASGAFELVGLHAHIGSQVFSIDSLRRSAQAIGALAAPYHLEELSVGGGLGVAYVEGEQAPSIEEWATAVIDGCRSAGLDSRIVAEPGRSIVAQAAVTLYTVGTIKEIPGVRTYVAVDGGMSDNPRPVLYGSGYETFLARAADALRPQRVRVVGKHCETGDVLVNDGWVPDDLVVGDVLATPVTGAYGHSMGSNYNKVLRPAVVFCRDGDARLVVRRETYDDLVSTDVVLGG